MCCYRFYINDTFKKTDKWEEPMTSNAIFDLQATTKGEDFLEKKHLTFCSAHKTMLNLLCGKENWNTTDYKWQYILKHYQDEKQWWKNWIIILILVVFTSRMLVFNERCRNRKQSSHLFPVRSREERALWQITTSRALRWSRRGREHYNQWWMMTPLIILVLVSNYCVMEVRCTGGTCFSLSL